MYTEKAEAEAEREEKAGQAHDIGKSFVVDEDVGATVEGRGTKEELEFGRGGAGTRTGKQKEKQLP